MKKTLKKTIRSYAEKVLIIGFWLLIWEIISRLLGKEILLPSPISVAETLIKLCMTTDFWQAVLFSSLRIIAGFGLSVIVGIVLAVAAYNVNVIKHLIAPLMKLAQAMPVASFIILALLWIKSKNLAVLTSFMMVMPLIYANIFQGLMAADEKLLQMARVFRISKWRKIRAIYIPAITPHFIAAVSVGVGLCWKAGIAAEVIGIPTGSIGQRLYESKIYLITKELFAWTAVIIIISILFEKIVMLLINLAGKKPSKGGSHEYTANQPDEEL
jgi:NitT/TauT family transport system permease protein